MHYNDDQAKLGYRGGVISRPKSLLAKTLGVLLGSAVLVSVFVVSIAFFAIALAFILGFGSYLWWKTRHLRRQMREQFQTGIGEAGIGMREARPAASGDVIEGVVISRKETSDHPPL